MGERRFLETVWSYPVLWLMQVSWIFHGVSMQVSCWLYAGFADLAYWCVTSMTIPWNMHGICMEPPWNLHQSERMIKPISVDRGTASITHMEIAWNSTSILHGTCMEPPCPISSSWQWLGSFSLRPLLVKSLPCFAAKKTYKIQWRIFPGKIN